MSHFAFAGVALNAVDMYNVVTGTWSTAQLSVPRFSLAAASAGIFAIFAGGAQTAGGLSTRTEMASMLQQYFRECVEH
jgi:hypothetical protein